MINRWLDSNYEVSVKILREKNWLALPVGDILNVMEAEWLANAIGRLGLSKAIGAAFEYESTPDIEEIQTARDAILLYNGGNCCRYVMITSPQEEFLYYKDDANRYYLLCGTAQFIADAFPCSWDTAKLMYFDQWVDLGHYNDAERRFMTDVWNKYAALRGPATP